MTRIRSNARTTSLDVCIRRENNCIIADPCTTFRAHTHTVIFLHDRDSSAEEVAIDLFSSSTSEHRFLPLLFPTFKWVFPQSKRRRSERNPRTKRCQWFDMWCMEDPELRRELQLDGLDESVGLILDVIRDEIFELGPDDGAQRIILGGVGQGCATALLALMHGSIQLGAFLAVSSWLPFRADMERIAERPLLELFSDPRHIFDGMDFMPWGRLDLDDLPHSKCMLETPVLIYHAEGDEMVPIEHGKNLWRGLEGLGMVVERRWEAESAHWISERGVDDIITFLKMHLSE